jgi:murein DD-endopeptidase MepM/ murein hydrolase activator NlpD
MNRDGVLKIIKFVVVLIALVYVGFLCKQSYDFYKNNKDDIWLGVEAYTATITLPIKLLSLSNEPKAVALPVPVYDVAVRDIADTWGEARSQGRSHEGTDIFAKRGTPVYSATKGYVVRVGENNLGGTIVFTMGPGGVRYYYAHLDSIANGIKTGSEVTADTVLGFVGDSGNASGTPPHLHFGMYDNGAQNPYPLLIDR